MVLVGLVIWDCLCKAFYINPMDSKLHGNSIKNLILLVGNPNQQKLNAKSTLRNSEQSCTVILKYRNVHNG